MNSIQNLKVLRKSEVAAIAGLSLTSLYMRSKDGLFPPTVSLGSRAVGYLKHEVDAVIAAQSVGASAKDIRELVSKLVEQRQSLAQKYGFLYTKEATHG